MKWFRKNIRYILPIAFVIFTSIGISAFFLYSRNNSRRLVKFRSGHLYYGDLKKGKANGYGELINPSGEIYTGWFKDGLFDSVGVSVFPVGDTYCGHFKNGMMSGRGIYTFKIGENYRGGFKNNLFYGFGVVRKQSGIMRYCGNWSDGRINGVLFNERISYESHGEIRRHVEKNIHMDNRDMPDQIIMQHNHRIQLTETFNSHAQTLYLMYDSSGQIKPGIGFYLDRYGTGMYVSDVKTDVYPSDFIYQYRTNKMQFVDREVDEFYIGDERKITVIKSFDRQNVPFFHLLDVNTSLAFCQPCLLIGLMNDSIVTYTTIVNYVDSKKVIVESPIKFHIGFEPYLLIDQQAHFAGIPQHVIRNENVECLVAQPFNKDWICDDDLSYLPDKSWGLFPELLDIATKSLEKLCDSTLVSDSLGIEFLYVANNNFNLDRKQFVSDQTFFQNFLGVLQQDELYDSCRLYRILYPQQTILDFKYGEKEKRYSIVFDDENSVISLRKLNIKFNDYIYESF